MSQAIKRHYMIVHAYYPVGEPRVQREAEARSRLAALSKNTEQFNQRYNWTVQSANYVRLVNTLCCSEGATSNKILAGGAVK